MSHAAFIKFEPLIFLKMSNKQQILHKMFGTQELQPFMSLKSYQYSL